MLILLALISLAAAAGFLKPYMNGKERRYFALTGFVALALVGATAPWAGLVGKVWAANLPEGPAAASKWQYSTTTDELRGKPIRRATLVSENRVDLGYPHGRIAARLQYRDQAQGGPTLLLLLEHGGLACHDLDQPAFRIRFDEGPIRTFQCLPQTERGVDIAAVGTSGPLLGELRRARRAVVEADLIGDRPRQFVFETAGLAWPRS